MNITKKFLLATSLLPVSLAAFAVNNAATCPPAELMTKAWKNLDTVTLFHRQENNDFYTLSISSFKHDGYSWHMWTGVSAQNMDNALALGQDKIKTVSALHNDEAWDMDQVFLCSYGTNADENTMFAVGAVAYKQEGSANGSDFLFNPASLTKMVKSLVTKSFTR
jgi:hypothetical protein